MKSKNSLHPYYQTLDILGDIKVKIRGKVHICRVHCPRIQGV